MWDANHNPADYDENLCRGAFTRPGVVFTQLKCGYMQLLLAKFLLVG